MMKPHLFTQRASAQLRQAFTIVTLIASINLVAQQDSIPPLIKDTLWKQSGFLGVNYNQTALNDWQGGGQSNLAVGSIFNLEIKYRRDKYVEWGNKLDAQFGVIRPGDGMSTRKNIDQLFFVTKYNRLAFGNDWFWTAQADYRTQFAPGYNYAGDSIVGRAVSDFNSPGYVQLALGLDYKPNDWLSVTAAPAAVKMTMVNRQYLADEGAYGVEKAEIDTNGRIITPGKKMRFEVGGRIIIRFRKEIVKDVRLDSYLDLFSNYQHNPGNIDVVFNNMLTVKFMKYFTLSVLSQALYDDDVVIKRDWDKDGKYETAGKDINGPRLQLLNTLSIGFGYKF